MRTCIVAILCVYSEGSLCVKVGAWWYWSYIPPLILFILFTDPHVMQCLHRRGTPMWITPPESRPTAGLTLCQPLSQDFKLAEL